MADVMQKVITPQWMSSMFKAIDMLDMSPASGFSWLDDNVRMNFNGETVQGRDIVKLFFVVLDPPFVTEQSILGVWQLGNAYVIQGHATAHKNGDTAEKTVQSDVFLSLIWVNDAGKVVDYIVSLAPGAGKAASRTP